MLYQLSYFRNLFTIYKKSGESRIRTYEGVRQQIYSLPQLATLVSPHFSLKIQKTYVKNRADGGIRTPDQLITNQLLWPTELHRQYFKVHVKRVSFRLGLQRYVFTFNPPNIFEKKSNFFQYFFADLPYCTDTLTLTDQSNLAQQICREYHILKFFL